ncbi:S-adenosylmethionine-dependent methyltransferase [Quillaja saponaria]|uniref:S-adenosylmethionine-dependent methyltransferase n=1 Tax=Quillaja saponaria TaxID=32244 RepID=A0AAD7PGU1_QUISA|nr:S-adenosylmethionine-dependent methyltransferase [Quillaja saponaria]
MSVVEQLQQYPPPSEGEIKQMKPVITVPVAANGGSGTHSYSKNSLYQQLCANLEKEKIQEAIRKKLDVKTLSSVSNTFRIADMGCAAGPNTFITTEHLLEAIKQKYQNQCPNSEMPQFQVFFSDLPSNDFNTLFASLPPDREYFAVGVPGSFYDRLFPESSLHFVYNSYALQWLSNSPQELQDKNSLTYNKGKIHLTSARKEVIDAYAAQFARDTGSFLNNRAKELVPGGMLVIVMPGVPYGLPYAETTAGMMFDTMTSILLDMVEKGYVSESQLDTFNLPFYAACPEDIMPLVEEKGQYSIERMELTNPSSWLKGPINIHEWIDHVRAAMEGHFSRHFGSGIVDDLFGRLIQQLSDNYQKLESQYRDKTQLSVILKRKNSA